jgi:hypothetical protein
MNKFYFLWFTLYDEMQFSEEMETIVEYFEKTYIGRLVRRGYASELEWNTKH